MDSGLLNAFKELEGPAARGEGDQKRTIYGYVDSMLFDSIRVVGVALIVCVARSVS